MMAKFLREIEDGTEYDGGGIPGDALKNA